MIILRMWTIDLPIDVVIIPLTTTFTMRPSIYEKLQMISCMTGRSVNSIVNELMERHVEENADIVEAYKKTYPEEVEKL